MSAAKRLKKSSQALWHSVSPLWVKPLPDAKPLPVMPVLAAVVVAPVAAPPAAEPPIAVANRQVAVYSGGPSVEALIRMEASPLLKAWLDQNLPPLVERLVHSKLAQVAAQRAAR